MTVIERAARGVSGRQIATGAAVLAGAAAVGAGLFLVKDKGVERPEHDVLVDDGAFQIRRYSALLVAETVVPGAAGRKAALDRGFRTLADYIFAKSRPGAKIAMTAPVLSDHLRREAGPSDTAEDSWRVRFVMPTAYDRDTLPPAPRGVAIDELPPRRVAAARFAGNGSDATLQAQEAALRTWLDARGETATGKAEYAFYDAPMIPGPLRRNEVLIPLG